jgi:hypothetical protein
MCSEQPVPDYLGTTKRVMDCAGNLVVMVLLILPDAGAVTATSGCETIAFRLALL